MIIGEMNKVLFSIGSNLGNRKKNIQNCIDSINNFSEDLLISYESKSTNGVIKVKIVDNGSPRTLSLKNNNRLKGITKNLNTIVKVIEEQNVNSQDIELLKYMVANAILAEVDEYSSLILPDEMEEFLVETKGTFGGLGIVIGVRENKLTVISPIDDTPASRAGILAGDLITHLDDEPVLGMTLSEAVSMMRGKAGSKIKLTVNREENQTLQIVIIRAVIELKAVKAKIQNNIGYIRVSSFNQKVDTQIIKAISKFKKNNKIIGYVLDLRNNPGGLLDQAVNVGHFSRQRRNSFNQRKV